MAWLKIGHLIGLIFFVVPDYDIIAFEEKAAIARRQFAKRFGDLWRKTTGSEIALEFLANKEVVLRIIKTWDKIIWASFTLRRNPDAPDEYKELDELNIKTNSRKTKIAFENTKEQNGLNLQKTIAGQALSMAMGGHGEFRLKGRKGDATEKVSTKETLITREKDLVDNLPAICEWIGKELRKIIKEKQNG